MKPLISAKDVIETGACIKNCSLEQLEELAKNVLKELDKLDPFPPQNERWILNVHQFILDLPDELSFKTIFSISRMPHIYNLADSNDVYYFNDSKELEDKFNKFPKLEAYQEECQEMYRKDIYWHK